jgi:hypothetical protein
MSSSLLNWRNIAVALNSQQSKRALAYLHQLCQSVGNIIEDSGVPSPGQDCEMRMRSQSSLTAAFFLLAQLNLAVTSSPLFGPQPFITPHQASIQRILCVEQAC